MLGTESGTGLVIVRAYGDEPVKLLAVGRARGAVLVARQEGGTTIGFPHESVYEYNAEQYDLLRQAFETNNRRALLSIWKEMGRAR